MRISSNRGITLVALIITVLILLIISAVSIGVIIDDDFFNKAQDTVGKAGSQRENQEQQQADAQNAWDSVPGRIIKSGTKENTTIELTATIENITRTSFRIKVEGTNKDNEDLTFSLKIEDRTYEYAEQVGKEVYWDIGITPDTPLTPATLYNFEVIGRDKRTENSVSGDAKTLGNNKPVIEQVTASNITATEATITVNATDADNDVLTYTLEINGTTYTANTGVFNVTGLTELTTYSYTVKVSDGFDEVQKESSLTTLDGNTAPAITHNYDYKSGTSKTTTQFTIRMRATDNEGDSLTYQVYASTSQNGTYYSVGTVTASASSYTTKAVTAINGTSLKEYTQYWWYITVTDGKETVTSAKQSLRTYCSGTGLICTAATKCAPSRTLIACDNCNATGKVACPGRLTNRLATDLGLPDVCDRCGGNQPRGAFVWYCESKSYPNEVLHYVLTQCENCSSTYGAPYDQLDKDCTGAPCQSCGGNRICV